MGYNKTINGNLHYVDDSLKYEVITANKTLKASDSGLTVGVGTDALVITLPACATVGAGVWYDFLNIGADGNNIITISPAAADAIHGTITLASSVVELSGADNKDLINTKASATTGNSVRLFTNGVDWFVKSSTGIWASEA